MSRPLRRGLVIAALFVAAAAACLVVTKGPTPTEGRNFFGHWRAMPILACLGLLWAATAAILAGTSRRALFGLLFATLLTGFGLFLLEAAAWVGVDYARMFGAGTEAAFGSKPEPNVDLRDETYPDIAHSWNLPTEPIAFHFRSDRRGFRNPEDRDAADVYAVGDSIVVAALLPFADTVTGRLEQALSRPVLNVALIGIGPQRELELLRDSGLPLDGRLVLHFITDANDLGDSWEYRQGGDTSTRDWSIPTSFTQNFIVWVQQKLQPVPFQAALHSGWIGDQRILFHWIGRAVNEHADEVPHAIEAIGAMRSYVEDAGGTYAGVLVPSKYRVLHKLCRWNEGSPLADVSANLSALRDALLVWSREQSVPILDLTEPMRAAAQAGELPYFTDDTHPNKSGHALMTAAILAWAPVREWLEKR